MFNKNRNDLCVIIFIRTLFIIYSLSFTLPLISWLRTFTPSVKPIRFCHNLCGPIISRLSKFKICSFLFCCQLSFQCQIQTAHVHMTFSVLLVVTSWFLNLRGETSLFLLVLMLSQPHLLLQDTRNRQTPMLQPGPHHQCPLLPPRPPCCSRLCVNPVLHIHLSSLIRNVS